MVTTGSGFGPTLSDTNPGGMSHTGQRFDKPGWQAYNSDLSNPTRLDPGLVCNTGRFPQGYANLGPIQADRTHALVCLGYPDCLTPLPAL